MSYLLILLGVAAGYYAATRLVKRSGNSNAALTPLIGGVLGGLAAYAIVITSVVPTTSGPIVWVEPVKRISTQAELNVFLSQSIDRAALVDFYADWCPPCRQSAPALNALAESGARIAVVDVDESVELADQYQITSLPTTLIFDGQNEVQRSVGRHTERELRRLLMPGAGS